MGGFLFASLSGIICINIVNLFVKSNSLNLWAACGSVISFYHPRIVYYYQLIIGGNHHCYQYSIDDHVFESAKLLFILIWLIYFQTYYNYLVMMIR